MVEIINNKKNTTQIIILTVFSIIWICKPIAYERFSTHQHQKTVNKVLEITHSSVQPTNSNNFKKEKIDLNFHH